MRRGRTTGLYRINLTTGAAIRAQASVVFDTNPALPTNTALNTIDVAPPTSTVAPLPASEPAASFPVSWSRVLGIALLLTGAALTLRR